MPETEPQSAAAIMVTVNGRHRKVNASPFATLADTLRDDLGLTGTKIGCDAGDCGACTVLIDGEQACACLVPTAQAAGAWVETVEGAGPLAVTDRLRAAFLTHGAAQCGICTPGMLMAATSLLAQTERPSRQQVEDAIGGVLCRCTGYHAITAAVLSATLVAPDAPPAPSVGQAVGARMARADGMAKVAGTDRFGADYAPADALWLRIVRSPYASARFTLGDLEAFRERAGLNRVLTAADIPGANGFGVFPHLKEQPILAPGLVRYRGEAVLALVGKRHRLERIDIADVPITWEPLAALHGTDAALQPGAPVLHPEIAPDNVLARGRLKLGDVDSAHTAAAVTVEDTFETSFVEHAYIEPEAGYAQPIGEAGDRIEVSACTQAPYLDLEDTARALGIAPSRVRILPTACGGGFGGKLDVSVQPILAVAAFLLKRPVRIVYSRIESMASSTKRHPARVWSKTSADAEGRITAFETVADFNTGAYSSWGPTVANRVPVHAAGPYRVPNAFNRTRAIYTNDTPAGAFRGFGIPQQSIATEALLDEIAARLGIDRWEIRRRNAIARGDRTQTGQVLAHSAGLPQCLDALKADWEAGLARVARHNERSDRRRRGLGIACMWYGCGNTSIANPSTMRLTLERSGRLTLFNGAVDIGQGSTTVILQIAADALGLPTTAFELVIGDTDRTFDAGKTSASRQTFVSGRAAQLAAEDLRRKLLAFANAGPAARLALDRNHLSITDGDASRVIDLSALPAAGDIVAEGIGSYDPPATALDADGQGSPYATYGFAAQIAEVEVDIRLGTTKVTGVWAAHDVGRAINPTLVEGQIHGGIAQGLGLALMEEYIPGLTENLHDYLIPTVGDMPPITTYLIEDPEPEGPYGAKGVGEPALVATAPAILGAIRHATGVVVRKVPVLPHRLWAALEEARS
jgi:CO/xanthine dehydrogenase Mo-binding subunit/aerobic-type carbon monoxide dehydrogenase small subunit (CoxS/CutS family)